MFQILILLSFAQWSSATTTPDLPTTIEIDVTSPVSNYNYPRVSPFPISFAIKNAYAAFYFRFNLQFTITGRSIEDVSVGLVDPETVVSGLLSSYGISPNSSTYIWDSDFPASIDPGNYTLEWNYDVGTCTNSGSEISIWTSGVDGSVNFTVAENGTLPTVDGCSGGLLDISNSIAPCYDVRPATNASACTSTSASTSTSSGNSSSSSKSGKSKEAVGWLMSFMAVVALMISL